MDRKDQIEAIVAGVICAIVIISGMCIFDLVRLHFVD